MRFVLMSVAILFWFGGCDKTRPEEKIRPVKTLELTPTRAVSVTTFNGVARSDVAARLSFKVGGTVVKIPVRIGQEVKAGDMIAELDDSLYRLKLDEMQASLKQARAKLSSAKNHYKRIKKLYVNHSTSLSELENARTQKELAEASYKAVKSHLDEVKLQLSYTKLKAPIDGSISNILIHENENISPAVTVATISSTRSIEVPISVPGSLIDKVSVGQSCEVYFDAVRKEPFDCEVSEVSHASDMHTTTFPVVVKVLEPSKRIRPGMAASVELRFNTSSKQMCNCYVVPTHALMEDAKGPYLYVVENIHKDVGVVKRRNVERGGLTEKGIIVTKGVRRHMHVLTAGMSRVQENQKVRLLEE